MGKVVCGTDRILGVLCALAVLLSAYCMAYAEDTVPEGCHIETKVCQVCAVDKDGKTNCSSVGIGCTPNELVCDGSAKAQTGDASANGNGGNETVIKKSE